jgi:serine protease AprX
MKTIKWILFICILHSATTTFSQQVTHTYIVYFKDKPDRTFNPFTYFDAKAIERRLLAGLALYDERDLPVATQYVNSVCEHHVELLVASRWLNALFIKTDLRTAKSIEQLPFVKYVDEYISPEHTFIAEKQFTLTKNNEALLHYQTDRFGASAFAAKGLTGKGIRIAVFDVGFSGADKHKAFQHLRNNNQIKGTYDFILKKENVYHGGAHGTNTLSCITGIADSIRIGMANDAEFLLARTEWNAKEKHDEEYFWLAASEWADKNGADIISSSLGYGKELYTIRDMDGKKSIVSFAATVAAQKGILVVNSAGNEYDESSWKTIITPADADSVLCIGGTNPYTDRHISFSSKGPSADKRMKPNVSAPGHVVAANPSGNLGATFGTSFSCPLVSGFAACAWQSNRSMTNMQLFKEIEHSAHLYPYFDYLHGYGIPQASYFTGTKKAVEPTFNIEGSDTSGYTITFTDSLIIQKINAFNLYAEDNETMKAEKSIGLNLYWNVQSATGVLRYYEVRAIFNHTTIYLFPEDIAPGDLLNIHFEGYTFTTLIK